MPQDTTSFVLRFVRETSEDQQTRWRGIINHVQSDTKRNFTQFAQALQFIQEQMGKEVMQEFVSFDPEFMGQAARTFQQLADEYQGWMLQAMPATFASPAKIQQALIHSLKAWQLPDHTEQEVAIRKLERLNLRLQELTHRVEDLEARTASHHPAPPQDEN